MKKMPEIPSLPEIIKTSKPGVLGECYSLIMMLNEAMAALHSLVVNNAEETKIVQPVYKLHDSVVKACCDVMRSDSVFCESFLLSRILDSVLNMQVWDKHNIIYILFNVYAMGDLWAVRNRSERELKRLYKIWKFCHKREVLSREEALLVIVQVLDDVFVEPFMENKLMDYIEYANKHSSKKNQVNINKVRFYISRNRARLGKKAA